MAELQQLLDEVKWDDIFEVDEMKDDGVKMTKEDEQEEMIKVSSTSKCPWEYEYPASVDHTLSSEMHISANDSDGSYKKKLWSQLWPNVTPDLIDPAQAAADYYLLFGMSNKAFVEFEEVQAPALDKLEAAAKVLGKTKQQASKRKTEIETWINENPQFELTEIQEDATTRFYHLVETLDRCFREYVHMACGGELRHHSEVGSMYLGGGYRRGAWVKWHYIYEQNGVDSLLKMAELFEEFSGGGYGGPPWANAARILHQRETGQLGPDEFTNKQLFVDRVFTLEHNGGCFLNKLDWINKRSGKQYPYSCHFGEMKEYVLEAHASNPANIDMLLEFASKEVRELAVKYLSIANDHDITIVGEWERSNKPSGHISINVQAEDESYLDWGDEEKMGSGGSNPLLDQLEESLHGNNNKVSVGTVSSIQDKLLEALDSWTASDTQTLKWTDLEEVK